MHKLAIIFFVSFIFGAGVATLWLNALIDELKKKY